jgi:hypothetical protein
LDKVWAHKSSDATFWEGRWWLHFPKWELSVEWGLGRKAKLCHAHVDLDNTEAGIMASFSIPWLAYLYVKLEGYKLFKPLARLTGGRNRTVGWTISDGRLDILLWSDRDCWNHDDPWWWDISIEPARLLLGPWDNSGVVVEQYDLEIPLPEGMYQVKVNVVKHTRKRKRFPFKKVTMYSDVHMRDNPIPIPGKGECAWDLDEDAIYSMGCTETVNYKVLAQVVESVMRTRFRYGSGTRWLPEAIRGRKHSAGHVEPEGVVGGVPEGDTPVGR